VTRSRTFRRIMHNQNISAWQSRRHLREVALTPAHDPALRDSDPDVRIALRKALGTLTPKQRAVTRDRHHRRCLPRQLQGVVAVSALDGTYRGLDLPGFDPAAYLKDICAAGCGS
jgi:hypothetical protein